MAITYLIRTLLQQHGSSRNFSFKHGRKKSGRDIAISLVLVFKVAKLPFYLVFKNNAPFILSKQFNELNTKRKCN